MATRFFGWDNLAQITMITALAISVGTTQTDKLRLNEQQPGRVVWTDNDKYATTTPEFGYASGAQMLTVPNMALTGNLTASGTGAFGTAVTVGGVPTCLLNGTNCPASSSSSTLQQVIVNGPSATATPIFLGGVTTTVVTTTWLVLSTAGTDQNPTVKLGAPGAFGAGGIYGTLGQVYMSGNDFIFRDPGVGTLMRAISGGEMQINFTNFRPIINAVGNLGSPAFSWNNIYASGTLRVGTDVVVNGSSVCRQNGTNCPSSTETDTLFTVTNRGSVATATLALYGGATVGSTLTATGTFAVAGTATSTFAGAVSSTNVLSPRYVVSVNGSQNAPAIYRAGTMTGIWFNGNAQIDFTVNGNSGGLIDGSNGWQPNIGIQPFSPNTGFIGTVTSPFLSSNILNMTMRTGTSTLTFGFASGTVSLPAWHLGTDFNSGFYTTGDNAMSLGLGGIKIVDCNANGCSFGSAFSAPSAGTTIRGGGLLVTNATMTRAWVTSGAGNTSTLQTGDTTGSGSRGCIVIGDSDGSGFTFLTVNNGVQSFSTTDCR